MSPEPAQTIVSSFVAGISSATLTLFGVSYFSLLWGLIGAVVMLFFTPSQPQDPSLTPMMNKIRVVGTVMASAFTGAILSDLLLILFAMLLKATATMVLAPEVSDKLHLVFAFVVGAGAKRFLGSIILAALAKIGGGSDPARSEGDTK